MIIVNVDTQPFILRLTPSGSCTDNFTGTDYIAPYRLHLIVKRQTKEDKKNEKTKVKKKDEENERRKRMKENMKKKK